MLTPDKHKMLKLSEDNNASAEIIYLICLDSSFVCGKNKHSTDS